MCGGLERGGYEVRLNDGEHKGINAAGLSQLTRDLGARSLIISQQAGGTDHVVYYAYSISPGGQPKWEAIDLH